MGGTQHGHYDMCLARRFGGARSGGGDLSGDGDDGGGGDESGWIPMVPGAFQAAATTVSTIDWTLDHGWFMSHHTNNSQ